MVNANRTAQPLEFSEPDRAPLLQKPIQMSEPVTAAVSDPAITIVDAVKVYPGSSDAALNQVSLSIARNELFTLLGPSGCGKTTLLRAIAGFEDLTAGSIALYGQPLDALPPNKRQINTVFQHYALFPHMSVEENVAYPLKRLGKSRSDIAATVARMLAMVKLTNFAHRRPAQLSGGQQQRVALARALAPHPKVLLLDEPLSALDLMLRQEMRVELKQLQEETGITFLFVTHDQEEALAMSDRIAVMKDGRVEQTGTANEIYTAPTNRFVASFIGDTNLVDGRVISANGATARVEVAGGLELDVAAGAVAGSEVTLSIRLENVDLTPPGEGGSAATVTRRVFLGTDTVYHLDLAGMQIRARLQNAHGRRWLPEPGAPCRVTIDAKAAHVLDRSAP